MGAKYQAIKAIDELAELREQRDALLEACKELLTFRREYPWTGLGDSVEYGDGKMLQRLELAIAKARGDEDAAR